LTYLGFKAVPTGFVPPQDQGYLVMSVQLPNAASVNRSTDVATRLTDRVMKIEGVQHVIAMPGFTIIDSTSQSNCGVLFVVLNPFDERKDKHLSADAIAQKLRGAAAEVQEAQVAVFGAPPIPGLGTTGGVKLQVQDKSGAGVQALQQATSQIIDAGTEKMGRAFMFSSFRADVPQIEVKVDRVKAKAMNVGLSDIFDTLQIYLGSHYVNDITLFGRTWQVIAQADPKYRISPDDIRKLKLRNGDGDMVPLGSLLSLEEISGPAIYKRYNMYPTAEITAMLPPDVSSGQGTALVGGLCDVNLPRGFGYEWTEIAYQEQLAGNTALFIFPLCVLFVFLTHSAEYESWALPLAIILIVPMSLLAAIGGVHLRGMDNNIFTQIGFVVLVGLACKNAVLIVEFAKQQEEQGMAYKEAALSASKLRLRPILMTSFAFILGVVPLVIGKGAGAEMRQALGTAVFFGMLGVTFFGLFLTPVFYVVLRWVTGAKPMTHHQPAQATK
jgi:multidrug efflux pump